MALSLCQALFFSRWRIRCDVRSVSVIVDPADRSHQGNGATHQWYYISFPDQFQAVSTQVIRTPTPAEDPTNTGSPLAIFAQSASPASIGQ